MLASLQPWIFSKKRRFRTVSLCLCWWMLMGHREKQASCNKEKIFYKVLQDAYISKESAVNTPFSIKKAISKLRDILPWCNLVWLLTKFTDALISSSDLGLSMCWWSSVNLLTTVNYLQCFLEPYKIYVVLCNLVVIIVLHFLTLSVIRLPSKQR